MSDINIGVTVGSIGSSLAVVLSYSANHSILWAILHGVLGWLYVIYFSIWH